ncbi:MAG: sigma-70 family RNA polymerase sigma factor [Marinifilaceae bacterium]|nr:sigma-70 family RNA polymerase sigma factor [Marinifilaceae bacterium]
MEEGLTRERGMQAPLTIDGLYDTYYDELVAWADAILGDVEAAEDVVQDFFVYLWEKGTVERLRREEVRAYLYAGVKHLAARRVRGRRDVALEADAAVFQEAWEEPGDSRAMVVERVMRELEKLPPRSREVVELVHLKGLRYAEVAEALGVSVATVKTLLVRSLKALRRGLSDYPLLLFLRVLARELETGRDVRRFS